MSNKTDESKQVVLGFWAAMQSNDFKAAGEFLHDDYVLEWPQSGERVRGRSNFVAINENYPANGRWEFMIHQLIAEGEQVVSYVGVTDGDIFATVVTFSTVRQGKIWRQTEFWPDPFEPAAWRAEWVERIRLPDNRDEG